MVFIKRDHPGKRVRDRHIDFINANWDLLALEAYKGWIAHGKRGLLVINEADFIEAPKGVAVTFRMGYLPEGSAEFDKAAGPTERKWFTKELYDPDVAMCVCFMRSDDGISSYRVQGLWERTPKALYQKEMMP